MLRTVVINGDFSVNSQFIEKYMTICISRKFNLYFENTKIGIWVTGELTLTLTCLSMRMVFAVRKSTCPLHFMGARCTVCVTATLYACSLHYMRARCTVWVHVAQYACSLHCMCVRCTTWVPITLFALLYHCEHIATVLQ